MSTPRSASPRRSAGPISVEHGLDQPCPGGGAGSGRAASRWWSRPGTAPATAVTASSPARPPPAAGRRRIRAPSRPASTPKRSDSSRAAWKLALETSKRPPNSPSFSCCTSSRLDVELEPAQVDPALQHARERRTCRWGRGRCRRAASSTRACYRAAPRSAPAPRSMRQPATSRSPAMFDTPRTIVQRIARAIAAKATAYPSISSSSARGYCRVTRSGAWSGDSEARPPTAPGRPHRRAPPRRCRREPQLGRRVWSPTPMPWQRTAAGPAPTPIGARSAS